jgi:hypothetical protein
MPDFIAFSDILPEYSGPKTIERLSKEKMDFETGMNSDIIKRIICLFQ